MGGSGNSASMKLPSAECFANTYGNKFPALKTFAQPSPADGMKRREMPANEEMVPKSKVEAPSCVLRGGQVGRLSENRWVHAPFQTILHKSGTRLVPKGQNMGEQGVLPV